MAEPRTLVCVIGQTRGHEIAWPSFKGNVLDTLNADLAVCIGVTETYDYADPYWQNAKYRWASPEAAEFAVLFNEAAAHKKAPKDADWRVLLDVGAHFLGGPGAPKSPAYLIYYRWALLKNLEENGLLEEYDRFIVTRSDFVWMTPHPPMSVLSKDDVWIPDGERYGGVTDRYAILSRDTIRCYLDIIDPIVMRPAQLREEMLAKQSFWNLESYIYFRLIQGGLRDRIRFFSYIMHSVRAKGGGTSWSTGSYSPLLGYCVKYPEEYWSSAKLSNLIRTKDDWRAAQMEGDRLVVRAKNLSRPSAAGSNTFWRKAKLYLAGLGLHVGHTRHRLRAAIYRRFL